MMPITKVVANYVTALSLSVLMAVKVQAGVVVDEAASYGNIPPPFSQQGPWVENGIVIATRINSQIYSRVGQINGRYYDRAQSFTVGKDGELAGIELYLHKKGSPTEALDVFIVPTDSVTGVPQQAPVLASGVITPDNELVSYPDFGFFYIPLLDSQGSPLLVSEGDKMAVIMQSDQSIGADEYAVDGSLQQICDWCIADDCFWCNTNRARSDYTYENGDAFKPSATSPSQFEPVSSVYLGADYFFRIYFCEGDPCVPDPCDPDPCQYGERCDLSSGSYECVNEVEEGKTAITLVVETAEDILKYLDALKGVNGLTSKSGDALDLVLQVVEGLQTDPPVLTEEEALVLLNSARNLLEAFQNQVSGKMVNGQIDEESGKILNDLAGNALDWIGTLQTLLLSPDSC